MHREKKHRVKFTGFPRHIGTLLKGHFFAGLLVLIPLGVIAWIVAASLQALWQVHELLPMEWRPETFLATDPPLAQVLNIAMTVGLTVLLAFAVSLFGWISKQYLGQKVLYLIGEIIQRIPVLRTVYSTLDQLLRTMTAGGSQQFSRVVYVEYPRKGSWTLAFVTGSAEIPGVPGPHVNVYVPTTPNPTSGFFLIVAESEIRETHLSVEEAFKRILSLGIAQTRSEPARHPGVEAVK